jgi:hypothetical protein
MSSDPQPIPHRNAGAGSPVLPVMISCWRLVLAAAAWFGFLSA